MIDRCLATPGTLLFVAREACEDAITEYITNLRSDHPSRDQLVKGWWERVCTQTRHKAVLDITTIAVRIILPRPMNGGCGG
jgi:hypothetical protein